MLSDFCDIYIKMENAGGEDPERKKRGPGRPPKGDGTKVKRSKIEEVEGVPGNSRNNSDTG